MGFLSDYFDSINLHGVMKHVRTRDKVVRITKSAKLAPHVLFYCKIVALVVLIIREGNH